MRATLPAEPDDNDLCATKLLEVTHPNVVAHAEHVTEGLTSEVDQAVALFKAVRDGLRYDPYDISSDPADYRASAVLNGSQRWCVSKAGLLVTLARTRGIPARLGFADVKNHLQSNKLAGTLGTDLFVWHGYSIFWLEGAWRKASPAFNIELCERFGVKVLDFDGRSDALLHAFDEAGRRHMEYVADRGEYQDLPFAEIMATFDEIYPDVTDRGETEYDPAFHAD